MGVEARSAARLAKVVELSLGGLELSLPQYRVLALLDRDRESAAGALADGLAVSRPSVTALVDGLVARGYVERLADDADRRRVRHALTASGRDALAAADDAADAALWSVLSHLPDPADRAAAMAALALWDLAVDAAASARRAATAAAAASPSAR